MVRLAIVCLLAGLVSRAAAQPATRPALHWSRGEGAAACIDPRTLALRVTSLTGSVLVEPTSADLSIEGHVRAASAGGFEVHVTSATVGGAPRGDRTLRHDGDDCRALDDAIAFVVALMIDPDLALSKLPAALVELGAEGTPAHALLLQELEAQPAGPVASAATTPAVRAVQPPTNKAEPRAPHATRVPVAFEVHGAALVSGGLPHVAVGGLLAGSVIPLRWLALEVQLRGAKMVRSKTLDQVRSVSASQLAAAVLGCPRLRVLTRVLLEACLGAELHDIRARGQGFADGDSVHLVGYGAHVAAGGGLELHGKLALRLRAFARFSREGQRFVYSLQDGKHDAFVSARISAGASLGLSYAF